MNRNYELFKDVEIEEPVGRVEEEVEEEVAEEAAGDEKTAKTRR